MFFLITSRYNGSSSVLLRGPSPPLWKALYQVWFKLAKLNLKKGFASDFYVFFPLYYSFLWKRCEPYLVKLNSLPPESPYPRKLCARLGWNGNSCSWENDIYCVHCIFLTIALWKVYGPYLNKPESLSPMNALGHV